MAKETKTKEKHTDDLRDPFIRAFRKCDVPMNRTSLNRYAVQYLRDEVGIRNFSVYVEDQRADEKELMDIEEAFESEGGELIPEKEDEIENSEEVEIDS